MSEREFVARRTALGNMLWFNRVLEELGIKHDEYVVPSKVLLGLEKKDATANNVTVVAEAKKRKGVGAAKVVSKKQKADVVAEVPEESSSNSTSTVGSNLVEILAVEEVPLAVGGAALEVPLTALEIPVSTGVAAPEPLALNLLSSLLGEESFDAEVTPMDPPREVVASEASPPVEVETNSSSEAKSACARRGDPTGDVAQPAGENGAGSYDLLWVS
jgi:hypothetical protein